MKNSLLRVNAKFHCMWSGALALPEWFITVTGAWIAPSSRGQLSGIFQVAVRTNHRHVCHCGCHRCHHGSEMRRET